VVTSTSITFAADGTRTVVVANAPADHETLLALTELQPALKPNNSPEKNVRNRLAARGHKLPQAKR
jgi:hypothetical protein